MENEAQLEFAVFCIENIALALGVDAVRVFRALTEESEVLNRYIIPGYEVLHTQSKEYIVEDILSVLRESGVKI